MDIGDVVVRKSYDKDVTFKIIDIREEKGKKIYILKGINIRIIADSPEEDLERVQSEEAGKKDEIFNRKVKESIKHILNSRSEAVEVMSGLTLKNKETKNKELYFGRPGKVLHVDGDSQYLEICMKTYKRIGIDVVGKVIPEKDQPLKIVDLVKESKPDIVVITGHDGMLKDARDYMDLNNYKNSKYFVESVNELRNYERAYDELVIFAGACQSCYEAILGAGANFASSPSRVLIHCLDPVFVCEKVSYTNIEKIVSIEEVIENTITGTKGIGGFQTRGKYREGFPKSPYV
ncbi:sporulation peptidase YabG [Haloimpatiens lingqiaonensis]|uniref:sporulation peptidase YabG n=1 Tax=Haloimpatiens lingqiaonensis TaxID=1380675 RepID=UPI0010FD0807|nr:sporulation peptidase YabG [Haloimpatiens lingqiaonensis]